MPARRAAQPSDVARRSASRSEFPVQGCRLGRTVTLCATGPRRDSRYVAHQLDRDTAIELPVVAAPDDAHATDADRCVDGTGTHEEPSGRSRGPGLPRMVAAGLHAYRSLSMH